MDNQKLKTALDALYKAKNFKGGFADSNRFGRVLSSDEVSTADGDLNVDFKGLGLLPVMDLGDNDFLVYDKSSGKFKKFNIVDQIAFGEDTAAKEGLNIVANLKRNK